MHFMLIEVFLAIVHSFGPKESSKADIQRRIRHQWEAKTETEEVIYCFEKWSVVAKSHQWVFSSIKVCSWGGKITEPEQYGDYPEVIVFISSTLKPFFFFHGYNISHPVWRWYCLGKPQYKKKRKSSDNVTREGRVPQLLVEFQNFYFKTP